MDLFFVQQVWSLISEHNRIHCLNVFSNIAAKNERKCQSVGRNLWSNNRTAQADSCVIRRVTRINPTEDHDNLSLSLVIKCHKHEIQNLQHRSDLLWGGNIRGESFLMRHCESAKGFSKRGSMRKNNEVAAGIYQATDIPKATLKIFTHEMYQWAEIDLVELCDNHTLSTTLSIMQ